MKERGPSEPAIPAGFCVIAKGLGLWKSKRKGTPRGTTAGFVSVRLLYDKD